MINNLEYGVHTVGKYTVIVDGLKIRDRDGNAYANQILLASGGACAADISDPEVCEEFWSNIEKGGAAFKRVDTKNVIIFYKDMIADLSDLEVTALFHHEACHVDNHITTYSPHDNSIAEMCEIEADAAGAKATSPDIMWSAVTKITHKLHAVLTDDLGVDDEFMDSTVEQALSLPQMLARKNALGL